MNRLIAYGVIAFALFKIFLDDKQKVRSEKPRIEGAKEEPKINMSQSNTNDVGGLYFEENTSFFN